MALDLNMTGGVKPPKKAQTPDPFAAMGGGVQKADGGWVPQDHPEAQGVTAAPAPPMAAALAPTAAPAPPQAASGAASPQDVQSVFRTSLIEQMNASPDPFASQGGGVQVDGGWVPKDHPLAQGATPTAAPAPVQSEPTRMAPVAEDAPTSTEGIDQELRAAILQQLRGNPEQSMDVANDPRAAAFRLAQRRNQDRTVAQAVEDAAYGGRLGSGGFEGDMRGINQARAESEAGFEAGLVGERMAERRAELTQAMAFAQALGDRESAADLQRELAQIDASLQREGYSVTQRGQDVQRYGIDQSANLDRLDQELRRYGLDLNDKQTSNRLGFDYAQLTELANRQAVLAALGQ